MSQMVTARQEGARSRLRVVTWNLQSCQRGLGRLAATLRALEADLVALQEVDRETLRSGGTDQAARLAAEAGFPYARFFTATRWDGGDYGLALLARAPILDPRVLPLPVGPRDEPRVLAHARLELDGGELGVFVTHLSHRALQSKLRARQAETIVRALAQVPGPKLLLGDLNDLPGSRMHRTLCRSLTDVFGAVGEGPGGTRPFAGILPAVRIDYLFASADLALGSARVHRSAASDHHPLVAELGVPALAASRVA